MSLLPEDGGEQTSISQCIVNSFGDGEILRGKVTRNCQILLISVTDFVCQCEQQSCCLLSEVQCSTLAGELMVKALLPFDNLDVDLKVLGIFQSLLSMGYLPCETVRLLVVCFNLEEQRRLYVSLETLNSMTFPPIIGSPVIRLGNFEYFAYVMVISLFGL